MAPWLIFLTLSVIATLMIVGGLLLLRRNDPSSLGAKRSVEDNRILYALLWLASLSIMAYIAFVFGKR